MTFMYSISLVTLWGQLAFSYTHNGDDLMPDKASFPEAVVSFG